MHEDVKKISDRNGIANIWLFSIVVFFIISNLLIARNQAVWLDETYTLNTTNQELGQVIHSSLVMEMQPPLYFIALKLWRTVNDSFYWARVFSIIIMAFSILSFYKLISLYFEDNRKVFITLLFALNPFTYWAAQEIRVYGLAILLLILQHHVFFKYFLKTEYAGTRHRMLFVITGILSVCTNYYLVFPLIANFILLIILKKYKHAWLYMLDMIMPVLSLVMLILFMPAEEIKYFYLNDSIVFLKPLQNITDVIRKYNIYLSGLANFNMLGLGLHNYHQIVSLIIYALLIYRVVSSSKQILTKHYLILICYLGLLSFLLFIEYFIIKEAGLITRYSFYIYPMLFVVFPAILFLHNDRLSKVIIILLIFCYTARDFTYYSTNQKANSLVEIANCIEEQEKPGQSIVFYKNINGYIFKEFYKGENEILFIPKPFNFTKAIDVCEYVINSENDLETFISDNHLKGSIWIITGYNNPFTSGFDYKYSLVNNYFLKYHKVDFDSVFSNEYQLRKIILQK